MVHYKLSPNEEARILKEEREKRKKFRIQQVREQSRVNAAKLRESVKSKKEELIEVFADQLKKKWEEDQEQELNQLKVRYEETVHSVGESHRAAIDENPEWKQECREMKEMEERFQAGERFRWALTKERQDAEEKQQEENKYIMARQIALQAEKSRAKQIASLPKPKPDPVAAVVPLKLRPVKFSDRDAFATTRYHIPETVVEKEDYNDKANAKSVASVEEEKYRDTELEKKRLDNERAEKARLRHKEAVRKELLKQDYEKFLQNIGDLQRADINRRRQALEKLPRQIFLAPHRRVEEKEDLQMNMERAFEDMYMSATDFAGDLNLALDPCPAAPSTCASLDVTAEEQLLQATDVVERTGTASSFGMEITGTARKDRPLRSLPRPTPGDHEVYRPVAADYDADDQRGRSLPVPLVPSAAQDDEQGQTFPAPPVQPAGRGVSGMKAQPSTGSGNGTVLRMLFDKIRAQRADWIQKSMLDPPQSESGKYAESIKSGSASLTQYTYTVTSADSAAEEPLDPLPDQTPRSHYSTLSEGELSNQSSDVKPEKFLTPPLADRSVSANHRHFGCLTPASEGTSSSSGVSRATPPSAESLRAVDQRSCVSHSSVEESENFVRRYEVVSSESSRGAQDVGVRHAFVTDAHDLRNAEIEQLRRELEERLRMIDERKRFLMESNVSYGNDEELSHSSGAVVQEQHWPEKRSVMMLDSRDASPRFGDVPLSFSDRTSALNSEQVRRYQEELLSRRDTGRSSTEAARRQLQLRTEQVLAASASQHDDLVSLPQNFSQGQRSQDLLPSSFHSSGSYDRLSTIFEMSEVHEVSARPIVLDRYVSSSESNSDLSQVVDHYDDKSLSKSSDHDIMSNHTTTRLPRINDVKEVANLTPSVPVYDSFHSLYADGRHFQNGFNESVSRTDSGSEDRSEVSSSLFAAFGHQSQPYRYLPVHGSGRNGGHEKLERSHFSEVLDRPSSSDNAMDGKRAASILSGWSEHENDTESDKKDDRYRSFHRLISTENHSEENGECRRDRSFHRLISTENHSEENGESRYELSVLQQQAEDASNETVSQYRISDESGSVLSDYIHCLPARTVRECSTGPSVTERHQSSRDGTRSPYDDRPLIVDHQSNGSSPPSSDTNASGMILPKQTNQSVSSGQGVSVGLHFSDVSKRRPVLCGEARDGGDAMDGEFFSAGLVSYSDNVYREFRPLVACSSPMKTNVLENRSLDSKNVACNQDVDDNLQPMEGNNDSDLHFLSGEVDPEDETVRAGYWSVRGYQGVRAFHTIPSNVMAANGSSLNFDESDLPSDFEESPSSESQEQSVLRQFPLPSMHSTLIDECPAGYSAPTEPVEEQTTDLSHLTQYPFSLNSTVYYKSLEPASRVMVDCPQIVEENMTLHNLSGNSNVSIACETELYKEKHFSNMEPVALVKKSDGKLLQPSCEESVIADGIQTKNTTRETSCSVETENQGTSFGIGLEVKQSSEGEGGGSIPTANSWVNIFEQYRGREIESNKTSAYRLASEAEHASHSNDVMDEVNDEENASITVDSLHIEPSDTGILDEPELTLVEADSTAANSFSQSPCSRRSFLESSSLRSFELHELSAMNSPMATKTNNLGEKFEMKTSSVQMKDLHRQRMDMNAERRSFPLPVNGNDLPKSENPSDDDVPRSASPRIVHDLGAAGDCSLQAAFLEKKKRFIEKSQQRLTEVKEKTRNNPLTSSDDRPSENRIKMTKTISSFIKNRAINSNSAFNTNAAEVVASAVETTAQGRKLAEKEMKNRTARLYNQLEEVKLKKEEEDRKAFYAQNREKRKDYEKKYETKKKKGEKK